VCLGAPYASFLYKILITYQNIYISQTMVLKSLNPSPPLKFQLTAEFLCSFVTTPCDVLTFSR
jgi:hypothetical protein